MALRTHDLIAEIGEKIKCLLAEFTTQKQQQKIQQSGYYKWMVLEMDSSIAGKPKIREIFEVHMNGQKFFWGLYAEGTFGLTQEGCINVLQAGKLGKEISGIGDMIE